MKTTEQYNESKEAFSKYLDLLMRLHVSHSGGFKAPHKAVLLITITEQVRDDIIGSPIVVLTEKLKNHFVVNWRKYIQVNTPFVCDIRMPFFHMGSEKFIIESGVNQIGLDRDLFLLMRDPECAETIIAQLISKYLSPFAFEHKVNFNELNPYNDHELRNYQSEAKANIYRMWTHMRSIMFQMPTGTGKTRLFVSIAKDLFRWSAKNKVAVKILFLAHRIELIDQISEDLGKKYGLGHGQIISGSREQKFYPFQVASIQTLIRRLDNWTGKDFDIIIVDEAHHVKAESYKKILRAFPRAKVLGVTATPYRMSHESFRPEFDELITSMPVSRFIKEGWLCDYDYYSIRPESQVQLDINSINRFAMDGDYLDEAAAAVMDKAEIRARIVYSYERYAKGKKGIVYTITKAHNIHICNQYIKRGYKAVAIDDSTPSKLRERYENDFRDGKIDIICNVNIFSEGFDCPDVEFIQLARPTKSLSMYLQQVGRGLRQAKGKGKEKLIILDNVGLYNRFGFPSARRHWRKHFEGYDYDYSVPLGTRLIDGQDVIFMDDFSEGDEDVEMLHTSTEEIVEEFTPNAEEQNIIYSYESEFVYYLGKIGKSTTDIKRIVRGLKVDVDNVIRGKYDSHHKSVLGMNDIDPLEIYLYEFQRNPVIADLNSVKNRIITTSLELYIYYLKWRLSEEAIYDDCFIASDDEKKEETASIRTLAEVELEISVFRKWNSDIPEVLIQEYETLRKNSIKTKRNR